MLDKQGKRLKILLPHSYPYGCNYDKCPLWGIPDVDNLKAKCKHYTGFGYCKSKKYGRKL